MVSKIKVLAALVNDEAFDVANRALNIFQSEADNEILINEFIRREPITNSGTIGMSLKIYYAFNKYIYSIDVEYNYRTQLFSGTFHGDHDMKSKQKLIYHKAKVATEEFIEKINNGQYI